MPQNILKCALLLSLCAVPALAQTTPDTTVTTALQNLSAQAATVFAGEVVAVRPTGGIVEIEFSIAQSLKGQAAGTVVLREWAGLWAAGQRRYWVGERAVVFLRENGKYGLSSSVDGMEGILPMGPDATSTLSVDVQRLRTRVLRDAGAPLVDSSAQMTLAQLSQIVDPQPISEPITQPISFPVPPVETPERPPVRFPIRNPIAEPRPVHNLPILVLSPEGFDELNLDNDTSTSSSKKSTPSRSANATY